MSAPAAAAALPFLVFGWLTLVSAVNSWLPVSWVVVLVVVCCALDARGTLSRRGKHHVRV